MFLFGFESRKFKTFLFPVAVVALSVMLAGCGGGSGGSTATPTPPPPTPTPMAHYTFNANFAKTSKLSSVSAVNDVSANAAHTITVSGCNVRRTLSQQNPSVSFDYPSDQSCAATLMINAGGSQSSSETVQIVNGKITTPSTEIGDKLSKGDPGYKIQAYETPKDKPTTLSLIEQALPPQRYPITFKNNISNAPKQLHSSQGAAASTSIFVENTGCFSELNSTEKEISSGSLVPLKTISLASTEQCKAEIQFDDTGAGRVTATFTITGGTIDNANDIASQLQSGAKQGKKLIVGETTKNELDFAYYKKPIPALTAEHRSLTTNFTSVGTPFAGCGIPGASFDPTTQDPDSDSGFNHRVPDTAFEALEIGKLNSPYAHNYIALNVQNTPAIITKNGIKNTFVMENNSIDKGALKNIQFLDRPQGNLHSTSSVNIKANGGAAPLSGTWDDGRNCGRWVKVDVYDDAKGASVATDAGTIWNKGETQNGLEPSDQSANQQDAFATVNLKVDDAKKQPLYSAYYLVHDSCQDNNSKCRGFDDEQGFSSQIPLEPYRYHVDLHGYSTVYSVNSDLDHTPNVEGNKYKLNTSSPNQPETHQLGSGGNFYIHWHYAKTNPIWKSGDKPIFGLLGGANSYYLPLAISHLRSGIHGVLYCTSWGVHKCDKPADWTSAPMQGDNGEVYQLTLNKDVSIIGPTIAVRIINSYDGEANKGMPYLINFENDATAFKAAKGPAPYNYSYLSKGTASFHYVQKSQNNKFLMNGTSVGADYVEVHTTSATAHEYPTKTISVTFTPATSNALNSSTYTGFESAELFTTGPAIPFEGIDSFPVKSSTDSTLQPQMPDPGYHGSCDATKNTCTFYVPTNIANTMQKTNGDYTVTMIGDVDVSSKKDKVVSEKKEIEGSVAASGGTLNNISTLKTTYISYADVNISGVIDTSTQPEDTDMLDLKVSPTSTGVTIPDNAPKVIHVPFDGSGVKQKIMYAVQGDGDGSSATNQNINLTIANKTGGVGAANIPAALGIPLFNRNNEAVDKKGLVTQGNESLYSTKITNIALTFQKGAQVVTTSLNGTNDIPFSKIQPLPSKIEYTLDTNPIPNDPCAKASKTQTLVVKVKDSTMKSFPINTSTFTPFKGMAIVSVTPKVFNTIDATGKTVMCKATYAPLKLATDSSGNPLSQVIENIKYKFQPICGFWEDKIIQLKGQDIKKEVHIATHLWQGGSPNTFNDSDKITLELDGKNYETSSGGSAEYWSLSDANPTTQIADSTLIWKATQMPGTQNNPWTYDRKNPIISIITQGHNAGGTNLTPMTTGIKISGVASGSGSSSSITATCPRIKKCSDIPVTDPDCVNA